ncbi:MAG: tetratricopeptide repeat protein [Nitrospirota bacterium]
MFCKSCYANLPDGTEICPKCNANLAAKMPIEETDKKMDSSTNSNDSSSGSSSADIAMDIKKRSERPRAGVIIIGSLAGIIFAFLAFVIYQRIDFRPSVQKEALIPDKAQDSQPVQSNKTTIALPKAAEDTVQNITAADPAIQKHLQDSKDYILNGKFQNAVESLKMALEKNPANQEIKKAISATYGVIAAKKAETGNYKDAVDDFKNAIRYFNEDSKLFLGMGSAYLQLNKNTEAADALNSAAALDPNLVEAYHLLADIYYKNDDVAKAVPYWEKVLSIDPSDQKARYFLSKANREKDTNEKFTKELTSHFTIRFEGQEEREVGRIVLSILEDAYREIGREISIYPETEVIVYLYTKQQFRDVTRSPSWAGALYDGKIRIPISGYNNDMTQLKRNLYHEYVHALVRSIVKEGRCPTWLNEGLAQYFEDKDKLDYRREMIKALQKNKVVIPVRNLEGSFMGFSSAQSHVAYSVSLAIVEFMIDRYGMYNVKRVLEELGKNKTIDEAMRDGLSIPYEVFQKEWQSDFEKGRG